MPAIVFDLDGTLLDSRADISEAFLYALQQHHAPLPPSKELSHSIGRPLGEMFAQFAPDHDQALLIRTYREYYYHNCANLTQPYSGVLHVLETLRYKGYKLAVATAKVPYMAERCCDLVGITPYLDHIQGTEGFASKPEPDVIFAALGALGEQGIYMVGDTTHDIEAGKRAKLKTYGVTWGSHDASSLHASGADVVADDLYTLLDVV